MSLQEWLKNILDVDKNVAASIVVTITIFVTGGVLKWLFSFWTHYNKRANNRRILFRNLYSIQKKLKEQTSAFQDTLDSLKLDGKKPFVHTKINFQEIDVIKQITSYDLFLANFSGIENVLKVCAKKRRRKAFEKIEAMIGTLLYWSDRSTDEMDDLLQRYNKYAYEINENMMQCQKILLTYIRKTLLRNESPELTDFMSELEAVHTKWAKGQNYEGLVDLDTSYINPIKAVCDKYATFDA
jgi:hypothetical protein